MFGALLLTSVVLGWPWPNPGAVPVATDEQFAKKPKGKEGGRSGHPKGGGKPPGFPKNIHRGPVVNGCVKKYK